jgi:hypothetical protein
MGVLDDAIREHLELKRKHGVSDEELRRQEEEALGPVRREVSPPEEGEASGNGEPPAERPETVAEDTVEPAAEPEVAPFDGEAPLGQAETPVDEQEAEPFAEEAAPAVPGGAEPVEPLLGQEEPEETAEPEPDWFDSHPEPSADHPPDGSRRFERESDLAEDGSGGDVPAAEEDESRADEGFGEEPEEAGDVLEDTPDFLEETPEHDRLWFEQKPPRDFDFD